MKTLTERVFQQLRFDGLDPATPLRWSVLVIDVTEPHAEPLIGALESLGFTLESVLRDPDDAARFFLHVHVTCVHDEGAFAARHEDVERTAAAHQARVADWSVRQSR